MKEVEKKSTVLFTTKKEFVEYCKLHTNQNSDWNIEYRYNLIELNLSHIEYPEYKYKCDFNMKKNGYI